MRLIQGDCLTIMKQLHDEGVTVDLILTDPPYGTIKNGLKELGGGFKEKTSEWDNIIPIKPMMDNAANLLRNKGKCILFSQEPFTSKLRNTYHTYLLFSNSCLWFKEHFANFLAVNKNVVNVTEDITIWNKQYGNEDHPLREYSKKINESINPTVTQLRDIFGHAKMDHFLRSNSIQFAVPSKHAYDEFSEYFNLNKYDFFLSWEEIKKIDKEYNSRHESIFNLYEAKHKTNIFNYKKERVRFHPTQKPVMLLKDLIKTYTNPGDTVLDFCMGSGSTGVACVNTERDFIGIELDKEYYEIAEKRIRDAQGQSKLTSFNNKSKVQT